LAFQDLVEYVNYDFTKFIDDYLATSFKNLVNFGPAMSEFARVQGVIPRRPAI